MAFAWIMNRMENKYSLIFKKISNYRNTKGKNRLSKQEHRFLHIYTLKRNCKNLQIWPCRSFWCDRWAFDLNFGYLLINIDSKKMIHMFAVLVVCKSKEKQIEEGLFIGWRMCMCIDGASINLTYFVSQ